MDQLLQSNRSNVLKYYNKSDTDVQSDVNIILTSLEKQSHFPKIKDEHAFKKKIENFLISNKFKLEKTKKKLDFYYFYRNIYPEFFNNWDPCSAECEKAFTVFKFTPLPQLTKDFNRLSYMEIVDNSHTENFEPIDHFKTVLMSFETHDLYELNTGEIMIYNIGKVNLGILKTLTPTLLKKATDIILKGYSIRFNGLHFLYPPPGFQIVLNILKVLIKPKLYKRIHLHNDLESLHKAVSNEYLPQNLGGPLPDSKVLFAQWHEMLKNNRVNLIEEAKIRSDESKRIDKLTEDEFFGSMHGSFKKLEFD